MKAPILVAGMFVLTLAMTLPLAVTIRQAISTHLAGSLMADEAADAVNFDWWQEFTSQASGLASSFTPSVIGFAATLDSVSSILDAQPEVGAVALALAVYLISWTFLVGGLLAAYNAERPVKSREFFAAAGAFFWRLSRLAVIAAIIYGGLYWYVHTWLFGDLYQRLTRDIPVERQVFAWRAGLYGLFGVLLVVVNVAFDYAKVRTVIEDRRSAVGALWAGLQFVVRYPGQVSGLYALNALTFVLTLAIWAVAAPLADGGLPSALLAFGLTQVYIGSRLLLKLQFLASQMALFTMATRSSEGVSHSEGR